MKVPEILKIEYMNTWQRSLVIAGLLMLLASVFIVGFWEGYHMGLSKCLVLLK